MEILADLPAPRRRALAWFLENAGQLVSWLPTLPDGSRIFSKPKGIYKPHGDEHALSVRQTLGGPYPDREPVFRPDGTWSYVYHQEGDVSDRDGYYTNRGLVACWRDGVPIGVARQVRPKPNTTYEILGVARVVDWQDGFFYLEGIAPDGTVHLVAADGPEGARLKVLADVELDSASFDPGAVEDARDRTLSSIVRRRGQPQFRALLLRIYGGTCPVSGCYVEPALEAAHVTPYLGPDTNSPQNGILLRSDLHTLWDLKLWALDEVTGAVLLGPRLSGTEYAQLAGRKAFPKNPRLRPAAAALRAHRAACRL